MAAQTLHAPSATHPAPVDITPPQCHVFAMPGDTERCPAVVTLNPDASIAQLIGFAHGRCGEMAMLAGLATNSMESEGEMRLATAHLASGLDQVIAVLDAIHRRL